MANEIENQRQFWVEISNALNLMRNGYATLPEQRLFLIYLSRINARNRDSRIVQIPLNDFIEICGLKTKQDISYYKKITTPLLQKVVTVELQEGYKQITLFGYCAVEKDKNTDEWYFQMGATQYADELFFNLRQYTSFQLENAL